MIIINKNYISLQLITIKNKGNTCNYFSIIVQHFTVVYILEVIFVYRNCYWNSTEHLFQLHSQLCHVGLVKSAMVRAVTPQKVTSTANWGLLIISLII